jgi:guanylate kinase
LLESESQLAHSISVTTREPRPRETEGVDYYFVSPEQFEALRVAGDLLEWAEVFGNFYGTPAQPVRQMLAEGSDIVFDVDWQGAASIASHLPDDTVRVFILPPSAEELSRRIYQRNSDSKAVIEARLKSAAAEISHWSEYDYVIVNHDIGESLAALRGILHAERQRRHRQPGLAALVLSLTSGAPRERARGAGQDDGRA